MNKDSGKAYTTYKSESKSATTRRPTLSCQCKYHCVTHVSAAERKRIFDDFYALADHDEPEQVLVWAGQAFSSKATETKVHHRQK